MNRLNYEDEEQTFVTGSNPYNYIWYSGKLWRVVSIDTSDNSVKLVTQWNISAISYDNDSSAFEGSYMEDWLNDTTVDGFLYNLREPEKFIKMASKWNASEMSDTSKPPSESEGGTIVSQSVGLLNIYEYSMSYGGTTYRYSYLNNKSFWYSMTPNNSIIRGDGSIASQVNPFDSVYGVRPSINLESSVKIVDGDGSEENPYRLEGDNDTNLEGTLLNTRYSGEYISFGTGGNNLYRIVSHETEGLTKITSAEPLKENGSFKTISFGDTVYYSSTNTIGSFLDGEYLNSGTYLTDEQVNMIEDSTTWYLGTVYLRQNYIFAKYTDENMTDYTTSTDAKVGLLRKGELMAGIFSVLDFTYWLITPYNTSYENVVGNSLGYGFRILSSGSSSIKPSLNLKSNVVITGGNGTKNSPFTLELAP